MDDRRPVAGPAQKLWGKLFGDKGYVSNLLKLFLKQRGVELLTKLKRNLKPAENSLVGKILLRKRTIVVTVFDKMKNISRIEHTPQPLVLELFGQHHRRIRCLHLTQEKARFELQCQRTDFNLLVSCPELRLNKFAEEEFGLIAFEECEHQ